MYFYELFVLNDTKNR